MNWEHPDEIADRRKRGRDQEPIELKALNAELLDTLKAYVENDEFNDALTNRARLLIAKAKGK